MKGIACDVRPAKLLLIKIDNWFGPRWLGFCGKLLGSAGVHSRFGIGPLRNLSIPPFVPARVVSQRRFAAPNFSEFSSGELLHRSIPSKLALRRKAFFELPNTAMVWFSGNTAHNDRGSLMAYVPINQDYWAWFVGFHKAASGWVPGNLRGITLQQLCQFQDSSQASSLAG